MLCVRFNKVENMMISTTPTMDAIPQVAAFVEEQLEKLEVPAKYATKLMVAVDEIYSNIVRYSGATEAKVRVEKAENAVKLTFSDNGKPYNPLIAEEPDVTASAEDRAIGGLGIFMVRKMMDDTRYMHKDDQNILTLTLNI
jgi:sigma-B regulation protein RsbU (phosphoserine phosphatase)